jgi:hypothetical protein
MRFSYEVHTAPPEATDAQLTAWLNQAARVGAEIISCQWVPGRGFVVVGKVPAGAGMLPFRA